MTNDSAIYHNEMLMSSDWPLFLAYLIEAIHTIYPQACAKTGSFLNASQLPPADYLATSLVNELGALPLTGDLSTTHPQAGFVLALDDYHLVDKQPVIAPIMGVITASFGAVLRDVFFARVPQSFVSGQLYAIAAAAGAIVYVLLWGAGVNNTVSFLACFVLTFIIRIVSISRNTRSH